MPMPGVQVEGLKELRRDLRKVEAADELVDVRTALKGAAGIVATEAQTRVPVRSGRARKSIRPLVSGNAAFVAGGKKAVPYYGWLDFGRRTPIRGRSRTVGPWKLSGAGPKQGRFIYPALAAKGQEVADAVASGVERALRKAGLHG